MFFEEGSHKLTNDEVEVFHVISKLLKFAEEKMFEPVDQELLSDFNIEFGVQGDLVFDTGGHFKPKSRHYIRYFPTNGKTHFCVLSNSTFIIVIVSGGNEPIELEIL